MLTPDSKSDNRIHPSVIIIRPAHPSDLPGITRIFNHAIGHTTASFYGQPRTVEQRKNWLIHREPRYAVLVADSQNSTVGWVALDPWSEKEGYRITTEISYYVDPEFQGQGIGKSLLDHSLRIARENGFRNILAKICEDNEASLKLAEAFGFQRVGTLKSIGYKFGRHFDVHFYQKELLTDPE